MDSTDNRATMTLDLKRNRIRIHKSTLKKLNDPKYIQFLINPEEMLIAFLRSVYKELHADCETGC